MLPEISLMINNVIIQDVLSGASRRVFPSICLKNTYYMNLFRRFREKFNQGFLQEPLQIYF